MITDHIYEIALRTDYKTTINLLCINQSCCQLKPWQGKIMLYGEIRLNSTNYKQEFKLLENSYVLSTQLIGLYKLLNNDDIAMYIFDHHVEKYYWFKNYELYVHLCPKMMIRQKQCFIEIAGKVISYTEKDFILFFTLLFYHYPDVCIEHDNYKEYLYRDTYRSLYSRHHRHYWESLMA